MRRLSISLVVLAAVLAAGALWLDRTLPGLAQLQHLALRPSLGVMPVTAAQHLDYPLYSVPVPLEELPPHLIDAVILMEDPRFRDHWGVDLFSIGAALWACVRELDLTGGCRVQGGSTITQQTAKNLFLSHDRSLARKQRELLLAFKLEWLWDKDTILGHYLDIAHFGRGLHGIEMAARHYFNKRARDLNLYESAMLVGLLPRPRDLNPDDHPQRARERALRVVRAMVEAGLIAADEAHEAIAGGPEPGERRLRTINYRPFADWVAEDEAASIESFAEGDRVSVTLDPITQIYAELAIERLLEAGREHGAGRAALVAMSPDGAVRAMVGSAWQAPERIVVAGLEAEPAGQTSLLDATAARAPLAGGGQEAIPYGLTAARGQDGTLRFWRGDPPRARVLSHEEVRRRNESSRRQLRDETIGVAVIGHPTAGEIGREPGRLWLIGWSAHLVVGLRVDGMAEEPGVELLARAFANFMANAHESLPVRPLPGLDLADEEGAI